MSFLSEYKEKESNYGYEFPGILDRPDLLAKRVQTYGRNVIPMKQSKSFVQLLWHALKEPTLIILEIAAVVSLAMSIWNLCRPSTGTAIKK